MIPSQLLRKVRTIQIRTSHRVDEMLAGNWHSAFKGRGIEFEEVRPYQVGDDVRTIDWNVTARAGEPFVKLFREERELTVELLVDLSGSQDFGTTTQTKRQLVAELSALLAMSAIKNNDKVGLTLFTDSIEKRVPAGKGSRHVLRLIRDVLYCEPVGSGTDIRFAIDHLNRVAKRRTVVFLISDFQDSGYERSLAIAARKHDLIPVVIEDPREREMPNVGLVRLFDTETGQTMTVDTSSRQNRQRYASLYQNQSEDRDRLFRKLRLRPLHLETGRDIVDPLHHYFHARQVRP